jgi:hypothetical protein
MVGSRTNSTPAGEQDVAKDKSKKKAKKSVKGDVAAKAAKRLKAMTSNPMVADIVASALVGAAAALKDAKKARQLAAHAGDEIETLAKQGAERGNAMWQLALDIGRRSLESLSRDEKPRKAKTAPKAKKAAPKAKKAAPKAKKAAPKAKVASKAKAAPKARKRAAPKAKAAPKARKRAAPKAKARPAKRQAAARR